MSSQFSADSAEFCERIGEAVRRAVRERHSDLRISVPLVI